MAALNAWSIAIIFMRGRLRSIPGGWYVCHTQTTTVREFQWQCPASRTVYSKNDEWRFVFHCSLMMPFFGSLSWPIISALECCHAKCSALQTWPVFRWRHWHKRRYAANWLITMYGKWYYISGHNWENHFEGGCVWCIVALQKNDLCDWALP